MIDPDTVEQVVRAINRGDPIRQIARVCGVSRGFVKALANGAEPKPQVKRSICPTCHFRVPMPCVYCEAKKFRKLIGTRKSALV